jgi:hypothetical protein
VPKVRFAWLKENYKLLAGPKNDHKLVCPVAVVKKLLRIDYRIDEHLSDV